MNKLIVYGDIHSYYDELVRLRQKTNPKRMIWKFSLLVVKTLLKHLDIYEPTILNLF